MTATLAVVVRWAAVRQGLTGWMDDRRAWTESHLQKEVHWLLRHLDTTSGSWRMPR